MIAGRSISNRSLKEIVESEDVVIFGKTWCPYTIKVKSVLEDRKIDFLAVDLDVLSSETLPLIQTKLAEEIGQKATVPAVFIRGKYIGGSAEVEDGVNTFMIEEWLQGEFNNYEYDIIVIGGGSGGLAVAKEAVKFNKKVALCDFVEPSPRGTQWGLGGTCANVGCIPKKLLHRASIIGNDISDAAHFGWTVNSSTVVHDWNTLIDNVQRYVKSLNWNYRKDLKALGVMYYNAAARLKNSHTLALTNNDGTISTVSAKNIIIATGGRPHYPDFPGAQEYCITSDDLFSLNKNPGKTLVIGASYVGLECAGFLRGLGIEVAVMVRSTLLRGFDQSIAERIKLNMESLGVKFYMKCVPLMVTSSGKDSFTVLGRFEDGNRFDDKFNTVLLAVGRDPNTDDLGLPEVGVKVAENCKIIVNEYEQTSVPTIFAIGDVAYKRPELTPAAILSGRLLVRRLCGAKNAKLMDYHFVPTTIFTPLEYGCCGESEEGALLCHPEDNVVVFHTLFRPLEIVLTDRINLGCYAKLVCVKDANSILHVTGLHILGPNAGEITQGFALALKNRLTKDQFDTLVGIHPTSAEVFTNINIDKASGQVLREVGSGC